MSESGAGNEKGQDSDWKQFPCGSCTREISVTLLSAAIAGVTLYMLVKCFWSAASGTAFTNEKDVLSLALGLFGTVTGYYFGRIPAEKAADAAKTAEQNTKKLAAESLDKLQVQVSHTPAADPDAHIQSLLSSIALAKANLS